MEGYIKLFRKFIKWEWYQKSEMVHLFMHFLLLANHEDGHWQGQAIKRGQFISGRNSLKKDTGISAQSIRSCIKRLKSTNEITTQSTNRFTLFTIVNWEEYQTKSTSKITNKSTNNQPATNQQLTTNKNDNNKKNEKNTNEKDFSFKSSKTFIPVDFTLPINKNIRYLRKHRIVTGIDGKRYGIPPNGGSYILYEELLKLKK